MVSGLVYNLFVRPIDWFESSDDNKKAALLFPIFVGVFLLPAHVSLLIMKLLFGWRIVQIFLKKFFD